MSKVTGHSCLSCFSFLISSTSVQKDFGGLEVQINISCYAYYCCTNFGPYYFRTSFSCNLYTHISYSRIYRVSDFCHRHQINILITCLSPCHIPAQKSSIAYSCQLTKGYLYSLEFKSQYNLVPPYCSWPKSYLFYWFNLLSHPYKLTSVPITSLYFSLSTIVSPF